jgi:N-acetylmuramoyl-L-alanine amidase
MRSIGRWWCWGVAWCLVVGCGSPATAEPVDRFDTVVLDAGHGGDDRGARGPAGSEEKALVLDVVLRLRDRLERQGISVILTRSRDEFVPLERRTAIANDARADLFLSIHANAARARSARGFETFFLSLEASDEAARQLADRENAAFPEASVPAPSDDPLLAILGDMIATEQSHESHAVARMLEREFAALDSSRSRGIKQAPFVVLMGLQMPATLVEIGFITNAKEEAALGREDHRDAIVAAITRAVRSYGRRYDARHGVAAAP